MGEKLRVRIVGQDTLAAATREACSRYFEVTESSYPDVLWVCYDTPLRDGDPDYQWVFDQIRGDLQSVALRVPVLISSQIPVGSIRKLEAKYPGRVFAYSPENIRVKTALADFLCQTRIVVGRRNTEFDGIWTQLTAPFSSRLILTTPETAEMVKHTLNCYLGLCIAWVNEIAKISKFVNADQQVVEEALLSERRVSPAAPLRSGGPFGGGHLARDIQMLQQLAYVGQSPIIDAITVSNGKGF